MAKAFRLDSECAVFVFDVDDSVETVEAVDQAVEILEAQIRLLHELRNMNG